MVSSCKFLFYYFLCVDSLADTIFEYISQFQTLIKGLKNEGYDILNMLSYLMIKAKEERKKKTRAIRQNGSVSK